MIVKGFDSAKLYQDLAWRVSTRDCSWNDVSRETGVGRAVFTRMARGSSPDVHSAVRLLMWLDDHPSLHRYLTMEEDSGRV